MGGFSSSFLLVISDGGHAMYSFKSIKYVKRQVQENSKWHNFSQLHSFYDVINILKHTIMMLVCFLDEFVT